MTSQQIITQNGMRIPFSENWRHTRCFMSTCIVEKPWNCLDSQQLQPFMPE